MTTNNYVIDANTTNINDLLPSCRTPLARVSDNPEVIGLRAASSEIQSQLDQIRDIKGKTKAQILSMIETTKEGKEPFISNTQLLNAMTVEERALCQRAGELRAKLTVVMSKVERLLRQS